MATVVDLGHRKSFRLGELDVRPSQCEVTGPGGREVLEPRVMQVLVVLAEAEGETVTRDDLMRLCWEGRIVGEDSINRVILKLRHLARGPGAESFAIETIRKVGFRLTIAGYADALDGGRPEQDGVGNAGQRSRLRRWLVPAGAVVALLAGTIVLSSRTGGGEAPAARPVVAQDAIDPAALDLATRGRAAVFEGTPQQIAQGINYFRQAAVLAPDDADIWGSIAMASTLDLVNLTPEQQRFGVVRVRQAARRAIDLRRGEAHGWGALASITPTYGNWTAKERVIAHAIANSDAGGPAPLRQEVLFLAAVGRTREALTKIERLLRIHPLVPFIRTDLIAVLIANGRLDEADDAAEAAAKLWPRDFGIWRARFFLLALNGRAEAAESLVADRKNWPVAVRPDDMARLALLARALRTSRRSDADAALASYRAAGDEGQGYLEDGIVAAAALDRPDVAFAFADKLYAPEAGAERFRFTDHAEYVAGGNRATALLFSPPVDRLWRDMRFPGLMRRIGLDAYWQAGATPDFCHLRELQPRCRALGLKV